MSVRLLLVFNLGLFRTHYHSMRVTACRFSVFMSVHLCCFHGLPLQAKVAGIIIPVTAVAELRHVPEAHTSNRHVRSDHRQL